jgi:hypothetical protein
MVSATIIKDPRDDAQIEDVNAAELHAVVCVGCVHVESTAEVLFSHGAEEDDGSFVLVEQDLVLGGECERGVD